MALGKQAKIITDKAGASGSRRTRYPTLPAPRSRNVPVIGEGRHEGRRNRICHLGDGCNGSGCLDSFRGGIS
jgi:hypothetical protein